MALTPASSHGGGLPSQWTTDANGNVVILSDSTIASGTPVLTIKSAGGATSLFELDANGDTSFLTRAQGFDTHTTSGSGVQTDTGLVQLNSGGNAQVILVKGTGGANVDQLYFGGLTAAPGAAQVFASDFSLWLSDTVGAPSLRAKVTDSAGTAFNQAVEQASPITSGALPTLTITSGTGRQVLTARAAETVTPFTGDGTNNAATCAIALSPDDLTYSTLATISIAAALNLTGVLTDTVNCRVPAGWYIKLTAVHGTLGTTTYY